jgi:Flp pilus assembly pilin Flp
MWPRIERLLGEDGATAAEYALMVGLIELAILGAAAAVGQQVLRLLELVPRF